jgi:hypothetical protein
VHLEHVELEDVRLAAHERRERRLRAPEVPVDEPARNSSDEARSRDSARSTHSLMYIPALVSISRMPNRELTNSSFSRSTCLSRVASDRECMTRTGVF